MSTINDTLLSVFDTSDNSKTSDPSATATALADQRFAQLLADDKEAKDTLSEITQNGAKSYWNWKIKEMRSQIADQVMTSMNLTPEKIAAMDAKTRVETENKILDAVEQRLKLAINEEMKRQQRNQLAANATLQSVVSAQDIMNV